MNPDGRERRCSSKIYACVVGLIAGRGGIWPFHVLAPRLFTKFYRAPSEHVYSESSPEREPLLSLAGRRAHRPAETIVNLFVPVRWARRP